MLEGLAITQDAPQQISQPSKSQQRSALPMSKEPSSQSSHDTHARPSYPEPSALSKVQHEVEDMLRESLNRFVCGSCGNSGRARGLFGIALGVITLGTSDSLQSILSVPDIPLIKRWGWPLFFSAYSRGVAGAPCEWLLSRFSGSEPGSLS